ncbi:hypothetical protein [Candidatus Uabimicrobium sp. HlEnr_7]|uniref:hypothetical protein n=1 Tax=Candidatus Uabimicrobium helgolandensis TaxID=3095367 RepID=UPI003556FFB1
MKLCFAMLCFFSCLSFAQVLETRRISFEITKFRNLQKITPDTITLNERSINPLGDAVLPGEYRLVISKQGYTTINKQITILSGKEPYFIKEFMIAHGITGFHVIRGDFDGEMSVDTLLLNGKKWDVTRCIPQGVHKLLIEKSGFHKIERKIKVMTPNFYLFEELESKLRLVEISFVSSYTKKKIHPQHVSINGIDLGKSKFLKPGYYLLLVKHNGYRRIRKPIVVRPHEEVLTLAIQLDAIPRKVVYQFVDKNQQIVAPDSITMNGRKVRSGQRHLPGKYEVVVAKDGYQTKVININIKPDDTDYQIKDRFTVLARKIKLHITGDFPVDEIITPKMITLNAKPVDSNKFVPGRYTLRIEQTGYVPFTKEIAIPPSHTPFLIKEELVTQLREVKVKICYDIEPPTRLFVRSIRMAPLGLLSEQREIKRGDSIKPGSYLLTIKQYGYDTIEVKQHVWPDDRPYIIDQKLHAKPIPLSCMITRDVPPPSDLPPYQVSIIPKKTRVLFMFHGPPQLHPGLYDIKITQQGYRSINKEVYIRPSEEVFFITGNLKAHKRKIAFAMKDAIGQEANIYKLQNLKTKKFISKKDEFSPGKKLELCAKFTNYPTVIFKMKIVPGVKPQRLPIPLVRLQPLYFSISQNQFVIDGISYDFDFTIDGKKVEQHHIEIHKKDKYNYRIMMPMSSKKIRFYHGYLFAEKSIVSVQNRWIIPHLDNIAISRLINHLERIRNQSSPEKQLLLLQKLTAKSSFRKMVQNCVVADQQILMAYLKKNNNRKDFRKLMDTLQRK